MFQQTAVKRLRQELGEKGSSVLMGLRTLICCSDHHSKQRQPHLDRPRYETRSFGRFIESQSIFTLQARDLILAVFDRTKTYYPPEARGGQAAPPWNYEIRPMDFWASLLV